MPPEIRIERVIHVVEFLVSRIIGSIGRDPWTQTAKLLVQSKAYKEKL